MMYYIGSEGLPGSVHVILSSSQTLLLRFIQKFFTQDLFPPSTPPPPAYMSETVTRTRDARCGTRHLRELDHWGGPRHEGLAFCGQEINTGMAQPSLKNLMLTGPSDESLLQVLTPANRRATRFRFAQVTPPPTSMPPVVIQEEIMTTMLDRNRSWGLAVAQRMGGGRVSEIYDFQTYFRVSLSIRREPDTIMARYREAVDGVAVQEKGIHNCVSRSITWDSRYIMTRENRLRGIRVFSTSKHLWERNHWNSTTCTLMLSLTEHISRQHCIQSIKHTAHTYISMNEGAPCKATRSLNPYPHAPVRSSPGALRHCYRRQWISSWRATTGTWLSCLPSASQAALPSPTPFHCQSSPHSTPHLTTSDHAAKWPPTPPTPHLSSNPTAHRSQKPRNPPAVPPSSLSPAHEWSTEASWRSRVPCPLKTLHAAVLRFRGSICTQRRQEHGTCPSQGRARHPWSSPPDGGRTCGRRQLGCERSGLERGRALRTCLSPSSRPFYQERHESPPWALRSSRVSDS